MIIRSNDVCTHIDAEASTNIEQVSNSVWSYFKRVILFTVPVLLAIVSIVIMESTYDDWVLLLIGGGIVLYYLGLITYFARKSRMTLKQNAFLALRIMILFSLEFGVVLISLVGGVVVGILVALLAFYGVAKLEYRLSTSRGVSQSDALKQALAIVSIPILVYLTFLLTFLFSLMFV